MTKRKVSITIAHAERINETLRLASEYIETYCPEKEFDQCGNQYTGLGISFECLQSTIETEMEDQ